MAKVTQEHIAARVAAIRAAALRLFVEKGIEGARMEEIAAEAGLSAGAIYRYFPSKEQLLEAVLTHGTDHHRELFRADVPADTSPLNVLLAKGRMVWDEIGTAEGREHTIVGMECALAAARYAEGIAAGRRIMWHSGIDFAEELLRQAQAAGEVDPTLDRHALAVTLLASWVGMSILELDLGADLNPDASFAVLVDLLRRCTPSTKE